MCIVIDTSSLSCVFDQRNSEHSEFKPVLDWILRKGKIVYGGTTYERELKTAHSFLKIFSEFKKINKVVVINKSDVDKKEKKIKTLLSHRNFDDPHIVAIIAVSGVRLICTNEKRAIQFLTNKQFYERGKKPKVYTSKSNSDLLCNANIVKCCKPSSPLKRRICKKLGFN